MNTGLMFSSETDLWSTPQDFYNEVASEFFMTTDVCADSTNAKCRIYYTKEQDGLKQAWRGVCWMNPPYGREIGRWIKKAYDSAIDGATIVALLPSRTDTKWFHEYIYNKAEIRFIKGRLKFGSAKNSAPFPSMLVIWRPPTIMSAGKE